MYIYVHTDLALHLQARINNIPPHNFAHIREEIAAFILAKIISSKEALFQSSPSKNCWTFINSYKKHVIMWYNSVLLYTFALLITLLVPNYNSVRPFGEMDVIVKCMYMYLWIYGCIACEYICEMLGMLGCWGCWECWEW